MADTPEKRQDKLSKIPSWIMVGFIIGALFSLGVQRELAKREQQKPAVKQPVPEPAAVKTPPPSSTTVLKEKTSLAAIENVFSQFESSAVWRNDVTEVALWNAETNKYSECFEVIRSGEAFYFRTIPQLTRPVIRPNLTPDLPLRFTEPEDVQMKRIKENNSVWLPPTTDPN
jgi:hypothetical protein